MTADLSAAALLSQTYGAPVWLFERSAAARAKASNSTVDAVLNSWKTATSNSPEEASSSQPPAPSPEAEPEQASISRPPAPSPEIEPPADEEGGGSQALTGAALLTVVAEARGMPESIIERSAKARAGAAGVSLDDVLHEWAQEEGLEAASLQEAPRPKATTISPLPTPAPKAQPPAAGPTAAPAAAALTGAALLTAVAEARGMPESLVERSAKARAKKTDTTVDDVLNEWAKEAGLATAGPQPPAAGPTAAPAAAALTGAALLTAVAEARGMPESLVERSAKA
ncbi:MAG: hypothetical protein U9R47_07920, partial [Actinomycetota bacterium]|nr:hypothetical protein [Actinomycetota bacterium]